MYGDGSELEGIDDLSVMDDDQGKMLGGMRIGLGKPSRKGKPCAAFRKSPVDSQA
jgi:hypothetical protein